MRRAALAALACVGWLGGCGGDSRVLVKVQAQGDGSELADVVQLRARFSNRGTVDEQSFPSAVAGKQPIRFPTSFSVTVSRARRGRLDIALDGLDAAGTRVAGGAGLTELRVGGTATAIIALARGGAGGPDGGAPSDAAPPPPTGDGGAATPEAAPGPRDGAPPEPAPDGRPPDASDARPLDASDARPADASDVRPADARDGSPPRDGPAPDRREAAADRPPGAAGG